MAAPSAMPHGEQADRVRRGFSPLGGRQLDRSSFDLVSVSTQLLANSMVATAKQVSLGGLPAAIPHVAIQGSFRGAPVTHYLDPSTGVNVIVERNGTFLSAWKLRPSQLWTVLNRGTL